MAERETCELPGGPERPDDPVGNLRTDVILERFEAAMSGVLTARDRTVASKFVSDFSSFARTYARTHMREAWEQALVRRLELSSEVQILLQFDHDVSSAARIAAEMVALPCHRRMAQMWEILVLAGYCRDRGHPEAVWPYLVKAVQIVDAEIPEDGRWLAERERFRSILAELWNAIDEDDRESLVPYLAPR